MKTRLLITLLMCSLTETSAHAAAIGLFSMPDCSLCNLSIAPGGSGTFYVRVDSEGLPWPATTFSRASFAIEGLPEGWTSVAVPSPQAIASVGDPLSVAGADISFGFEASGSCFLLYTVTVTAPASGGSAQLRVIHQIPFESGDRICPTLSPPTWWQDLPACVNAGLLYINMAGDCTVAVVPATWSQMKGLYE
jgi:hypothetical protein